MSHRFVASAASAAAPAAAAPFAEFRNAATRRCYVYEVGVFLGAATASGAALARAGVQGTGGASSATGQAEDSAAPNATATGLFVNAFTVAPTFTAANTMRRVRLPAAIGAGIIWSWPESDPLIVPVSGSLVVYNNHSAAGAAATDVYIVWGE